MDQLKYRVFKVDWRSRCVSIVQELETIEQATQLSEDARQSSVPVTVHVVEVTPEMELCDRQFKRKDDQ